MVRSIPEKTLEHWCSLHLSYRYRAHLHMWWPASGEDIDVALRPEAFGKRIWLELKTTEWNETAGTHDLSVDLAQLRAYGAQAVPDYYVFPIPRWEGILGTTASFAWLHPTSRSSLAYQSKSSTKWFASWLNVVPGDQLRHALATDLRALAPNARSFHHVVASTRHGTMTWRTPDLSAMQMRSWSSFWDFMDSCGNDDWDAQFVVPADATQLGSRRQLRELIRALKSEPRGLDGDSTLVTLTRPDAPNNADGFTWGEEHRSLIALDAQRLLP